MGALNGSLESRLRQVAADPRQKPVVDVVRAVQHDGATSSEVLAVALKATRDSYVRSGRVLDSRAMRADAFLAAATASIEKPYQLEDAPGGVDKAMHFFVSGFMAAKIKEKLAYLPAAWSDAIARTATLGIGFIKEITDIPSSGFSRADLSADIAGASRALENG